MTALYKRSIARLLSEEENAQVEQLEQDSQEVFQKYSAAMRQMAVRLEVLDEDLKFKNNRNPIQHIEMRLKEFPSAVEKLHRYEKQLTIQNMVESINDIAGLRVICSYIQDVYNIFERLKMQDDLQVVIVKDYIENPKPNGYRSLHMIVKIPVYLVDAKEEIPVEIQIRTIAMDFWASLEHDLKYKAVREIKGVDSYSELQQCGKIIEDVEARMQVLARALEVE